MSDDALAPDNNTDPVPDPAPMFVHNGHRSCLRVVLTAYWQSICPSTEVFYVLHHPFEFNVEAITKIENDVMQILTEHSPQPPLRVIYISGSRVDICDGDMAQSDWRVIHNQGH